MRFHRHSTIGAAVTLMMALSGCGGGGLFGGGQAAQGGAGQQPGLAAASQPQASTGSRIVRAERPGGSRLRDLFNGGDDPNITIKVNKYIWAAALDVLNFLPIESIDPFTGVIVTGYGRPPGGGRAYRATILVQDPALDARSLKLAMQAQGGGAVDPATIRAVEDAILSRARELRIADGRL